MTSLPGQPAPPTAANTAAVVVSYYPDAGFQQRLVSLGTEFVAVFWVDNSPQAGSEQQAAAVSSLQYLPQVSNIGLAAALNTGCRAALDAGFEWVLTFDQDSDLFDNFLVQHIACWHWSPVQPFILGCNYYDAVEREKARFATGDRVAPCATVITSGSMMNLPLWHELGGFCDGYFIDGVDHEICLRARSRGLLVARHGRVLMQHRIGEKGAGFSLLPYSHSPLRKYYSTRNGVRNILQYCLMEPLWALRKCLGLGWEFLAVLLLEPDKRLKIRAMFQGLVDALRGKSGMAGDDYSA
jgi:rhamnosyltransferase